MTYDDSTSHQSALAHILPTSRDQDPDLALIVGAWDRLPEAVRPGIVAMVKAASGLPVPPTAATDRLLKKLD
jgi:hypothetical protein